MSKIQITDLNAAGNELFQGESFLTELQSVEANAIYGGKKRSGGKKTGGIGKSSAGKNSVKSSGGSMCPPPPPCDDVIITLPGND